jgi:hypothetical protein
MAQLATLGRMRVTFKIADQRPAGFCGLLRGDGWWERAVSSAGRGVRIGGVWSVRVRLWRTMFLGRVTASSQLLNLGSRDAEPSDLRAGNRFVHHVILDQVVRHMESGLGSG